MIRWLALLVLGLGCYRASAGEGHPPRALVDHGACPFECCHYGRWTTDGKVRAYARANAASPTVAWLVAGSQLSALDGFVRTSGQPFQVQRAHAGYRPGDVLMVYTYLGEGFFRVWHAGQWRDEDLGFSPYGGATGVRCTDRARCWGSLSAPLRVDWWVRARLADGRIVWVRGDDRFSGQDACG